MHVSNGLSFFSKRTCLFVCLWLITMLKLKGGEATNTTSLDNYDVFHPSPISAPKIKYDVFVNFRGEIRNGFLAHLRKAFKRKQIFYFIDDDELSRGEEISKSLPEAIETSFISLVIFSQNYASSKWCLDELVKIIQCKHKYGQIVLPIFYKVEPREVRKQMSTYGEEFVKHEKKYNLTRVLAWRSALKESADISGFSSSNFLNDGDLIEEIVKWVLGRLDHVLQLNAEGLIGISKQVSHVESLLQVHSKDVRAIGVWGMSGIGKTTIVEEVYNRLCLEHDRCCFMANVREELEKHGAISLKGRLFSILLREPNLVIDTPYGLPSFVERRLLRMKVLIVLDDVNDRQQLEKLIGSLDWFGAGSRIIITTRDMQVVANTVGVYEVRPLNFNESFELFNLNAFEKNHLEMEYYDLAKEMVEYAQGIPLVLKVLGQQLRGKKKRIWETQLERLKTVPLPKVHDVIGLSYNDLHRDEKKIFLDIACFFDRLHLKVDDINVLIKGHGYSLDVEFESLRNKQLIIISQDNVVSMHNIIQKSAWEIVRQESIEDPGYRSRLWDPDDIYQVLKNNKGSVATRSIVINLSIIKELQLDPHVFAKMRRLQYLDIYRNSSRMFLQNQGGLYFPHGLDSIPNEVRYLHWKDYPLESLPSKFSGENLVTLNLQNSNLKKVWNEQKKDLVNLKSLILSFSSNLVELLDFSKTPNLVEIDLRLCVGLTSVHSSIFSLYKLEKLDLSGIISLKKLPTNIHLNSLRYLSLASCTSLKEFSITSKNMIKLDLQFSGIRQLSSSIGIQGKLRELLLSYTYIENLPESIKHLPRLRFLDLRYCRELQSLPELPSSLKTLDASGCVSLETVNFPPIVLQQQMENKIRVSFWNCLKLDEQSLKAIGLNAQINIKKFAQKHISKLGHDYNAQGTYVYPGSSVPEWIVYRTTLDYMNIDLSFREQLGLIFCFIIPEVASQGSILRINISVGEGEDIQVYLDRPSHGIKSNHVYLIYDQGFSHSLISRVKNQTKFKIKVTAESQTQTSEYVPLMQLRGFGFSPINTSLLELAKWVEPAGPGRASSKKHKAWVKEIEPILISKFFSPGLRPAIPIGPRGSPRGSTLNYGVFMRRAPTKKIHFVGIGSPN